MLSGSTETTWSEAATPIALLACIFSVFGLIGTRWGTSANTEGMVSHLQTLGLWHGCSTGVVRNRNAIVCYPLHCFTPSVIHGTELVENVCNKTSQEDIQTQPLQGWHNACQIVFPIGFTIHVAALLVLVIYQCCKVNRNKRSMLVAFIIMQIIATCLCIAVEGVFDHHIRQSYEQLWGKFDTSWSLHSVAAANSFAILSIILVIVQLVRFPLILYAHDIHRFRNESEESTAKEQRHGYTDFDATMESPVGGVV